MKICNRLDFMAWREMDETAYALVDNEGYFFEAINCCRDGDMGVKDKDGIYGRHWWGDWMDACNAEANTFRPMTIAEVELYMRKADVSQVVCTLAYPEKAQIIIVKGRKESYALIFENYHKEEI